MSIIIKQLSYIHPDKEALFQHISLSVSDGQKISIIGRNGSGKSTLLRILSGNLPYSSGEIVYSEKPYYIPQHFGQYNELTIAEALGIAKKLNALHAILAGDASVDNFNDLNDDWNIEDRALAALAAWGLERFSLSQKMDTLSGGEKTKVFLSGIAIHSPSIILLDEPSNHLDKKGRKQLYRFVEESHSAIIVVSHDRTLLNLLDLTYELTSNGMDLYGGNYEFYKNEKEKKLSALQEQLDDKEKALRLARKTAREAMERQQKHDVRGEKANAKKGVPRIVMGNLKSKAEKSTSKLKDIHANKIENIAEDLSKIKNAIPDMKELKLNFGDAALHTGKILIDAKEINFGYGDSFLWQENVTFQIRSGDRILIAGNNGAGKTTLIKLLLGQLEPQTGTLNRAEFNYLFIDQEYSIINNALTIYEQTQQFNTRLLPEHELKMNLTRFLFPKETWNKKTSQLSGGEKMRLMICCMQVANNLPDIFVLDEPTNNLDIQSLEILTSTLRSYQGTILLISHDGYFSNEIGIEQTLELV